MTHQEDDHELPLLLAEQLSRVTEFARSFSESNGSEPLISSVGQIEMNSAESQSDVLNLTADDVYKAYSIGAGIWLPTVSQFVLALTQLYQERMALYGFQVVARAAVETSSKVWWILDPTLNLRLRISRYFINLWVNVEEMRKLEVYGPGSRKSAEMHWGVLKDRALGFGFTEEFGKNGSFIGFNGERVPEKTKLVRDFLTSSGVTDGEKWYRYLSAIAHSTSFAIMRNNQMILEEGSKRARLDPVIPRETIVNVAVLVADSYLSAVWNHASLFGFDSDKVACERLMVRTEMLNLL